MPELLKQSKQVLACFRYKAGSELVQTPQGRGKETLDSVGEPAGVPNAEVKNDNIACAGGKVQGRARRIRFLVTPRHHAEPVSVRMVL